MKKLSIRMTALLLALLMALTLAFVGCDETEDDKKENSDDNKDNGIEVTEDNAEAMLKEACEKFKTITSLDLAVVSPAMGETQTDRTLALINADGDLVAYAENDIGGGDFEYSYSVGTKRYAKYPYSNVAFEYDLEEELTFTSLLEQVFDFIFDNTPEKSIEIFCKSDFEVSKIDGGYYIGIKNVGAEEFFKAMLEEEAFSERIEPSLSTITEFDGNITFELYSDGNFKTIAFAYNATISGENTGLAYSYEFNKYNDDSIKIEEPEWVTEYKENNRDDDNSENPDGGSEGGESLPDDPDEGGGNEGGGEEIPDDTTGDSETPNEGGETESGSADKSEYGALADALNEIKNSETLEFLLKSSDGTNESSMMLSSVKGSDGSYKIYGKSEEFEIYIDADGNFYQYADGAVTKSSDEEYGLDYILKNYLSNYGFTDVENVLERMCQNGFTVASEGENTVYTFVSDYIEFSKIIDPTLAENEGFQSMVSQVKESSVAISFTLDGSGTLKALSADVRVDLDSMILTIDETVDFTSVNGMVEFDEPEWVANAK